MSEEKTKKENINPIFYILMIFLLLNIQAVVLCFFLFYLIKEKNRIFLILLIAFFVSIMTLYPSYLLGIFKALRYSIVIFVDTGNFLRAYLGFLGGYSILNHFCILHLSFILVFSIKELADDKPKIKSFDENLKELEVEKDENEKRGFSFMRKKEPLKESDFVSETIIGYKNALPVTIPDDARHVFYAGTTGAGKTVALANAIDSAITKDYGLLILDGKGDIGAGSLLDIVNTLRGDKKLYVFNMKRPEASDKYNPFLGASPSAMRDMLINLTTWSEEHYKANTELYLQTVIDLILKCGIEPSFETLIDNMTAAKAKELNNRCLSKEKTITKQDYLYNLEVITNADKIASSASARFLSVAKSDVGQIFDKDGVDIFEALKQKAIVLFILDPMKYPELATAFGKLVLVDAIKAVSKLDENPLGKIFYVFDEISTYVSQAIIELVGKSRSYGVTCHLATQAFNDLIAKDGVDYRERIIENCNSYVIMRQNSDINAEKWAKIIGTTIGTSSTYQLSGNKYTGAGTATFDREFIFHPDDIKYLPLGTAIFICKDIVAGSRNHSRMIQAKIKIRKCF